MKSDETPAAPLDTNRPGPLVRAIRLFAPLLLGHGAGAKYRIEPPEYDGNTTVWLGVLLPRDDADPDCDAEGLAAEWLAEAFDDLLPMFAVAARAKAGRVAVQIATDPRTGEPPECLDSLLPPTVWIVGQVRVAGPWKFQGVFTTEAAALAACRSPAYFLAPALLNEPLPDPTMDAWPGARYPNEAEPEETDDDAE